MAFNLIPHTLYRASLGLGIVLQYAVKAVAIINRKITTLF